MREPPDVRATRCGGYPVCGPACSSWGAQGRPSMRSPSPAQAKFISVAAAWRAVTPGVALAQAASDSAAPTRA